MLKIFLLTFLIGSFPFQSSLAGDEESFKDTLKQFTESDAEIRRIQVGGFIRNLLTTGVLTPHSGAHAYLVAALLRDPKYGQMFLKILKAELSHIDLSWPFLGEHHLRFPPLDFKSPEYKDYEERRRIFEHQKKVRIEQIMRQDLEHAANIFKTLAAAMTMTENPLYPEVALEINSLTYEMNQRVLFFENRVNTREDQQRLANLFDATVTCLKHALVASGSKEVEVKGRSGEKSLIRLDLVLLNLKQSTLTPGFREKLNENLDNFFAMDLRKMAEELHFTSYQLETIRGQLTQSKILGLDGMLPHMRPLHGKAGK